MKLDRDDVSGLLSVGAGQNLPAVVFGFGNHRPGGVCSIGSGKHDVGAGRLGDGGGDNKEKCDETFHNICPFTWTNEIRISGFGWHDFGSPPANVRIGMGAT